MKKKFLIINFKNIALESIGLIFIGFGVEKLYIASQSEKYLALLAKDFDKFEALTPESIGWFSVQSYFWRFGGIATGFLIIGLIKIWNKNKMGLLNSLIAFIIVFSLIPIGFFSDEFSNSIINFIGGVITENLKIKFIINGLLWTLIGLGIIWFALKRKGTTHNNG